MTQWHLNPIVSGYWLALLVLVAGTASLTRPFATLATRRRAVFIGLRGGVILLALVLMLRPTRVHTTSRPVSAVVLLLFDQSRSMSVPDMADGASRWQAQREMLEAAAAALRQLPKNLEVGIYGFDAAAHQVELTAAPLPLASAPDGQATDHGGSLDDALRSVQGKRLAAVFLAGDGAQRAYTPRVEMHQAANEIRRQGAPLYTIAFGKDVEKSQARDVAVENLRDHYSVFVKNELLIQATLSARGFANHPLAAELVIEDAAGRQTVLGPVQHTFRPDQTSSELSFTYVPQEVGQYRLTLRAAEQPGELVTKNNELTAFLTVRHGGLKVLFVHGEVQNETRFLRRAIGQAEDIQLDDVWVDHHRRERWPVDVAEKFRDAKYDVFILGSLSAQALDPASIAALADAVAGSAGSPGKGLLLLGGRYSFGPGRWADTPLASAFPVILDRKEVQDFDAPLRAERHWLQPLTMLPAQGHYITSLAPAAEDNRAAWRALPPLDGANRFDRLAPQAMILAQSETGVPLLLARDFGDGRVLAFAGDSTWRWTMHGQQEAHRRFWRQAILWLAKKNEAARDEVWIDLLQRRFSPGGRVEFTAGVQRSDGGTTSGVALAATVTLPSGQKRTARLVPEGAKFIGLFQETRQAGNYTIEVTAAGLDRPVRSRFVVLDEDLELTNPSANPETLEALAEITKELGGRRISPQEVVTLLEEIKRSPPQLQEPIQERFEVGRTFGTAWLFFLGMAALLAGEWYLRKRWGLV